MIISRTPFRVSFVGGGTDIESYYTIRDGQVISTSIDKYIYVCIKKPLHKIVGAKYRIAWSKLEYKDNIDDIEHPIVREALKMLKIDHPLEVVTFADVPAHTGLGSSSAFAVGLLNALYAMQGATVSKHRLATEAAALEIERLNRPVGKQDHFASSYGNLNVFTFHKNGVVSVDPVCYSPKQRTAIESRLLLFYTEIERDAGTILKEQKARVVEKNDTLAAMANLVPPVRDLFASGGHIDSFGKYLHQNWELKRSLTSIISTSEIDTWYSVALQAGATGGKLLGAGGGGFILLDVPIEKQSAVREALSNLLELQFKFDDSGSRISFYDER
jgi:D-glycero-alpha-D-manno-heptose-7-phosphate kinase